MWSTPRPGRCTPRKESHCHSYGRWVGPRAGLDGVRKVSLLPSGFEPPDRAICSESPYRLSCRGLLLQKELNCIDVSSSSFVVIFFPWIRILSSPENWEMGREACVCLVVKPERKRPIRRPRRKWEYNIKMMWTELIWLWIGTSNELLLQTRWWNFGFDKMRAVAWKKNWIS